MRRNSHQGLIVGRKPKYAPKNVRATVPQRGTMRHSVLVWCAVVGLSLALGTALLQGRHTQWAQSIEHTWVNWTAQQGFVLKDVKVTNRHYLSAADLWRALNVKQGTPLFALNLQAMHNNLVALPWVKSANISRMWPSTLRIMLQERVAVAQWQINGQKKLVDADSVILADTIPDAFKTLPVVVGNHAPQKVQTLLQLLQGEPNIAKQMMAATWVGNRRWNLHFKNNLVVKLPEENPQLAFAQLAKLDAEQQLLARDLVAIDLRLSNKAVLQPTPRANLLIQRPNFDPDAKVNQPAQGKQI